MSERNVPRPAGDGDTVTRPGLVQQVREKLAAEEGAGASAPQPQARPVTGSAPAPQARPSTGGPSGSSATATRQTPVVVARNARRARLRLTRLDPWSVMKTSFLLSCALGVVTFVAVLMVWSVLGMAGVWESVNSAVASIDTASTFDVTDYLGTSRVLGFTALVAVFDVVLLTALATLGAFLYNMAAALLGGIEMTFAEEPR